MMMINHFFSLATDRMNERNIDSQTQPRTERCGLPCESKTETNQRYAGWWQNDLTVDLDLIQDRPFPGQHRRGSTPFQRSQSEIDGHKWIERSVVKQH
jgi:hypothetical protein